MMLTHLTEKMMFLKFLFNKEAIYLCDRRDGGVIYVDAIRMRRQRNPLREVLRTLSELPTVSVGSCGGDITLLLNQD